MTRDSVTLEVRRGTRPETVLAAIREQAPGLLMEEPWKPPEPRKGGRTAEADRLLTPAEVAALFKVDPTTVTRWANEGRLSFIRTLGGHRRYREAEVRALMASSDTGPGDGDAQE